MNCSRAHRLLALERDQLLNVAVRAELEEHVAQCPACQRIRSGATAAVAAWRATTADVPAPDAAVEWQAVRQRLHPELPAARPRRSGPARPWLGWAVWPVAAAAAIAVLAFIQPAQGPALPTSRAAEGPWARADFVETGAADASTVVFVDETSGWLIVWAASPPSDPAG